MKVLMHDTIISDTNNRGLALTGSCEAYWKTNLYTAKV